MKMICLVMAGLLLACSETSCKKEARDAAKEHSVKQVPSSRNVRTFFTLSPGMSMDQCARILGPGGVNIGSGVFVLEYPLRPNGHALVYYDPSFLVSRVEVCYSTTSIVQDDELGSNGRCDEFADAAHEREQVAARPLRRIAPEVVLDLQTGQTDESCIEHLGEPASEERSDRERVCEYFLVPHGVARVHIRSDNTIEGVSMIWWLGRD